MESCLPNQAGLTMNDFEEMYRLMWQIRFFDEQVEELFAAGKIHGTTHLSIGQEATAVGSGYLLQATDFMTTTHRGHANTIAKGADMSAMMAELFGKKGGTNHGKGGSMHIADSDTGNLGSNGIVGGGYPIAVGAALTAQMKKKSAVVMCYAGDGSTNEGSFHESLNLASIWSLPVIFFIENNQYGMSSPIKQMVNIPFLSKRAESYGFEGKTIDGNNWLEVVNATSAAIEKAQNGGGPTLIEALTYRSKGHSKSDKREYRSKEEEKQWQLRDPILLAEKQLLATKLVSKKELNLWKEESRKKVQLATLLAEKMEDATLADLETNVYAE
ncbi:thiamine pyrophosphate-dependent dehydrogenase E1 component subunit alpha [Carnobacterium funditum]|uniref:thiamine pyrophosphate-dependent dehydrogenase E1 component subunit alpha n=1 Tax=Carnobacterium funditum TaxID=2752 RepID=UPI000557100D|nr:thiamine pyrophosphate-dependent dehydrogenase E1 component subunit alpha [Carnobacterium funditum]